MVTSTPRTVTAAMANTLVMWASAFVAIRVAVQELSIAGLTVARLLIASIVLAAAVPVLSVRRPALSDLPRLAACGLTGMLSYQFLLNAGERTVAAGTAALLVQMVPIFTALLAWLLLLQRPSGGVWLGMGLGFLGAVIIVTGQNSDLHVRVGRGTLLVLGAAVCQAAFFVLQKPLLERYSGFEATCYATWMGCLFALPFVPWAAADLAGVSADGVLSVVFLGVGPSAIGYATWAYAMARSNVTVAVSTLYLVPPIAVAIGWIVLREIPAAAVFVGGLIVIGGVAVTHRAPPARDTAPAHSDGELKDTKEGSPMGRGRQGRGSIGRSRSPRLGR